MGRLHMSLTLTSRLSIKDRLEKTFLNGDAEQRILRSPAVDCTTLGKNVVNLTP